MMEKKTAKSILLALTLIVVFTLSTLLLRAQTGQETNDQITGQTEAQSESQNAHGRWRELQAQRLEGTWLLTVSPVLPPGVPQPPSFHPYATISRGGTFIGSDRSRPFDGPQHGTWEHLGGNRFAWGIIQDRLDAMGNFQGTFAGRTNVRLTGRDTLVGVASVEFRDANGNITLARCATVKGERHKLMPAAEQCQGITPPQ